MRLGRALIVGATLSLWACVLYPTSRTFYEPNVADGKPVNRASCGYMTTHDSLERDIGGAVVTISPSEESQASSPGMLLHVYISIQSAPGAIAVDPTLIQLQTPLHGTPIAGNVLSHATDGPRPGWPYDTHRIDIDYPGSAETEISLVFQSGAVVSRSGADMHVEPFRFRRVTKKDMYYGSVNC